MNVRLGEAVVVGAGLVYLAVVAWAMGALSYDIWGALILIPIYGAIGTVVMQRLGRGAPAGVTLALTVGLAVKLGGAIVRYWVGFEAYEGGIDAGEYSRIAIGLAEDIFDGNLSVWNLVPREVGTPAVERITTMLFMTTGTSTFGGFVTFAFLGYLGVAMFVRAAVVAVPGLVARRYAWLCVLFPSLVYWPSSIGKEALVMLGLGVASLGAAHLYIGSSRVWATIVCVAGIAWTGLIRPHMAGIWLAAVVAGLVVLVARPGAGSVRGRQVGRVSSVTLLVLAVVGLAFLSAATIQYLEPRSEVTEDTNSLSLIIEETTRRTAQAESAFAPPSVSSPVNWPFAVVRTLTRPLPFDANGGVQLASAMEMVALVAIFAFSWRSLAGLPRMLVANAYVAFAFVAVFLSGLAYASFANLGVLTRQKSLVLPLVLLLACLPAWRSRREERAEERAEAFRAHVREGAGSWT